MNRFWFVMVFLLVGGCATKPPHSISRIPPGNLTVAEVRTAPDQFMGSEIRWGGVIARVENKSTHTWVEIVSRELGKNGKPKELHTSSGRFIASFPGFIDPMVYRVSHLLTVIGTIENHTTQPIGEFEYSFPVVNVSSSHLWPKKPETMRHEYPPPPWWYYDPWPFYRYPYPPYRRLP